MTLSVASGYVATSNAPPNAISKSIPANGIDWCSRLTQRLPGVTSASCQKLALTPSGSTSANGFPLLIKHIVPKTAAANASSSASSQAKSQSIRILLLGGIHGDEMTASAIVFQWMQWMQSPPAQNFEWMVAPLVNPDGMLAATPTRVNAHGVDLNRNFPTPGWQQDAPHYWSKVTGSDPRRFPGAAPLSEPETRWLNEQIERFKPEVIISVHAPYGVLDFDGPAPTPHQFGRLIFNPVGVYPGSLGNYSGVHKNMPVITIELPNATAMPADTEVKRIWLDMLTWIQRNVRGNAVLPSPVAAATHASAKSAQSTH